MAPKLKGPTKRDIMAYPDPYYRASRSGPSPAKPRQWTYPPPGKPNSPRKGFFRAIYVDDLRGRGKSRRPQIKVAQFRDVEFGAKGLAGLLRSIQYVAISHVWRCGQEVVNATTNSDGTMKELLQIKTSDSPGHHDTSWIGLRQMADAAYTLGATYIWLDLLCVDQDEKNTPEDKMYQICMMKEIYRYAKAVVVMIGGVASVQSVAGKTGWIDRAWNLQEAILNPETYVYVTWPTPPPRATPKAAFDSVTDDSGTEFNLTIVDGRPHTRLIYLKDLLDMADTTFPSPYVNVEALDGLSPTWAGAAPRHALRAAVDLTAPLRTAGIWRSLLMRRSQHPVDLVYSAMGCFWLQIDPFRYKRSPEYLFSDLARKTAAIQRFGPAWLIVSGIEGSKMPRDARSKILPRFPDVKPNAFPTYAKKSKSDDGLFVDPVADYVKTYDIRFVTQSQPHIISAYMALVDTKTWKVTDRGIKSGGPASANGKLRNLAGKFYFRGPRMISKLPANTQAVYVGRVADSKIGGVSSSSAHSASWAGSVKEYFFFMVWAGRSNNGAWDVLGDGVFVAASKRDRFDTSKFIRWIFTLGEGAQAQVQRWRAPTGPGNLLDSVSPKSSVRIGGDSYFGIIPLGDITSDKLSSSRIIYYNKKKKRLLPQPGWTPCTINVSTRGISSTKLNKVWKTAHPLYLATAWTLEGPSVLPVRATDKTRIDLSKLGELDMCFVYSGWKKSKCVQLSEAGIQGLIIPESAAKGRVPVSYWVSLYFGEKVVYLITKFARNSPSAYYQIAVIPYDQPSLETLNLGYFISGLLDPLEKPRRRRQRRQLRTTAPALAPVQSSALRFPDMGTTAYRPPNPSGPFWGGTLGQTRNW